MSSFDVDPEELKALRGRLRGILDNEVRDLRNRFDHKTLVAGPDQCGGVGSFTAAREVHQRYAQARSAWEALIAELERTFDDVDAKLIRIIQAYEQTDQQAASSYRQITYDQQVQRYAQADSPPRIPSTATAAYQATAEQQAAAEQAPQQTSPRPPAAGAQQRSWETDGGTAW